MVLCLVSYWLVLFMILQAKQFVAESGFIDFKETKGSAYDDGASVCLSSSM